MGTPGEDVAIFSRAESGYTVEFYSNKGEKKDTYQADGYIKVIDKVTNSTSEGTDTLYGIEALQFSDGRVGFEQKEALIDLDGDGKPDVGSKSGTNKSDTLTGGDMDEKMAAVGDDTLFGGAGSDFLEGGVGSDILIGGTDDRGSTDVAKFDGNVSDYAYTKNAGKFIAKKADGTYELNDDQTVKMYDKLMDVGGKCDGVSKAASVDPTSDAKLKLDGDLVAGGKVTNANPSYAKITSIGDDSAVAFTAKVKIKMEKTLLKQ